MKLVYSRGLAMRDAGHEGLNGDGAMLAVFGTSADECAAVCASIDTALGTVEVANINSADQVVLSGNRPAVVQALAELKNGRRRCKGVWLPVSTAFHSQLMRPAVPALSAALCACPMRAGLADPARTTLLSNVTPPPHTVSSDEQARAALLRQLTSTIDFQANVSHALQHADVTRFVEVGPQAILASLVQRIARGQGRQVSCQSVQEPTEAARLGL